MDRVINFGKIILATCNIFYFNCLDDHNTKNNINNVKIISKKAEIKNNLTLGQSGESYVEESINIIENFILKSQ
jgi:hypothetical protein